MSLEKTVLAQISTGVLTLAGLAEALESSRKSVSAAAGKLQAKGLIEFVGPGRYDLTDAGWRLIKTGEETPQRRPRTKTRGVRERAWWVLRARGMASIRDLLTTIDTRGQKTAPEILYRYLRALALTGFLVAVDVKPGDDRFSIRYRLIRNNGRKAPVHRVRSGEVFDPNDGQAYALPVRVATDQEVSSNE